MAVGTHWGMVHVLDLQGNNIEGKEFAKVRLHVMQACRDSKQENGWLRRFSVYCIELYKNQRAQKPRYMARCAAIL